MFNNPLTAQNEERLNSIKNEAFKPGSIIERVKDELEKTVTAKRKLLEKNFISFRFDEFKKQNEGVLMQVEAIERKKKRM